MPRVSYSNATRHRNHAFHEIFFLIQNRARVRIRIRLSDIGALVQLQDMHDRNVELHYFSLF